MPQAPCFSNPTYSPPAVVPNPNQLTTIESGSVRREPSVFCSKFDESEQIARTRELGNLGSSLSVLLKPIWSNRYEASLVHSPPRWSSSIAPLPWMLDVSTHTIFLLQRRTAEIPKYGSVFAEPHLKPLRGCHYATEILGGGEVLGLFRPHPCILYGRHHLTGHVQESSWCKEAFSGDYVATCNVNMLMFRVFRGCLPYVWSGIYCQQ